MLIKFKKWWKQIICKHKNIDLLRWHLVHYPEHDPLCVEAEYRCVDCDKVVYKYYRGEERAKWEKKMGNRKRV